MSATTDAGGIYTLTLFPGTYTVTAGADGYFSQTVPAIELVSGTVVQDWDLDPIPVTLAGQVRDSQSLDPISGALIAAGPTLTTSTDLAGTYTMTLLPGTYTVTASAAGYFSQTVPNIELVSGTVVQDLDLDPIPVTLAGQVRDSQSLDPIPGALIAAGPTLTTSTDLAGTYTMTLLPGTYTITASAAGYFSQTVPNIELVSGTVVQNLDLDPLSPVVTLAGQVRDSQSLDPISGALIAAGPTLTTSANIAGHYTMTLLPGTYTVTASAAGYLPQTVTDLELVSEIVLQDFFLEPTPLCQPISDLHLDRTPAGDLFVNHPVYFWAQANGTIPFTYTWTLNGVPAGENRSAFEHTFASTGTYTVSVTVINPCGQDSATLLIEVQESPPGQPDLSLSYKLASLSNVESGDLLTYTIRLRNSSAVTAIATLTDTVPTYTTYISHSAQASDGSPVTLVEDQLLWAGQIVSGNPILIQFVVEVLTAPVGTQITNLAWVDDGAGNMLPLIAHSTYNPGYKLTINKGNLYTNIPTVTLGFSWNAGDGITHVKISNDGGFGPGGDTTEWLPVNPSDPTYEGWILSTYGHLILPRTVYAKFRDANGQQFGPVQDDIIYDPVPPQVGRVRIVPQLAQDQGTQRLSNVTVWVTASDDNSGVDKVQISHSSHFTPSQSSTWTSVTGPTTAISWTLQPSGKVYARAVDRAGNISPIGSTPEPAREHHIYMPLLYKNSETLP